MVASCFRIHSNSSALIHLARGQVNVDDNMRRIIPGRWTHVALTWDGTTRKVYVNGILDGQDTPAGSLGSNSEPVEIGGRLGGSYMFLGFMDDFKLFNRALSDGEIADMASGELGSNAITQCNGGRAMVTLTSSHCEVQTGLVDQPGESLSRVAAPRSVAIPIATC